MTHKTAIWKALALTLFIALSCTKTEIKKTTFIQKINERTLKIAPDAMKNLTLGKAEMNELPERLDLMGRVTATEDRTTVVPARVAGRINAIYLASGESVIKGQRLTSIFSPDFVSAREEYLQSLKQSRVVGADASAIDFANFSQLARKKLQLMGLTDNDIKQLPFRDTRDQDLVVRSPRDGVIIAKNATLGNLANVGDNLFTIADISKVWFSGDIYSEDLPRIHKNQEVVIDGVPGTAPLYGQISFISPIVDPNARTIKIRALMDNPNQELRADMYVHGGVILSRKQALLVPTTAVIQVGTEEFVYKTIGDNQVERIPVKAGKEFKQFTSIESGLTAGTEIVSDGGLFLEGAIASLGE